FTGNGDTTAVCTAGTNSETCVYTDSAHTDKSDSYNFTVGNQPAGTTITTTIEVATGTSTFTAVGTTGGCDKATATLTMAAAPTPTPSPAPSASATPTPSPVASVPVPPTGLGPTLPIAAGLVVLGLATVALAIRRKGDLA
ncbi:MAG: hypothetical protein ACRDNK_17525, partial [Solirubrobacteraceae bacterium]